METLENNNQEQQHQNQSQQQCPFVSQKFIELSEKINSQKHQCAVENIAKLENIWFTWLNQQKQMKQVKVEIKPNNNSKEEDQNDEMQKEKEDLNEKTIQLTLFFDEIKDKFLEKKLYKSMTIQQMTEFWEDAKNQVQNKIKLYDEIEKLKLLSLYPSTCKRSYSKQANIILKKWLIDNYTNPYPTTEEVRKMAKLTNLTEKQILNWFINARNNFKNRSMNDKKFRKVVSQRYQELLLQKKRKEEQSENANNINNNEQNEN